MQHQIMSQNYQQFYLFVEPQHGRFAVVRQDVDSDHEPTGDPRTLDTFRYRQSAEAAVRHHNANGRMPLRTKFSVRQTRQGDWLVFNAIGATYGPGIFRTGDPAPGYTTGAQHGRYATEADALAKAQGLADEYDGLVVEWQPPAKNPQFIDLPRQYPERDRYETLAEAEADGWIQINPSKSVHHHRGRAIYVRDVTAGRSFGYDLAICAKGEERVFTRSSQIWANTHPGRTTGVFSVMFRTGDVVDAIHAACRYIDGLEG